MVASCTEVPSRTSIPRPRSTRSVLVCMCASIPGSTWSAVSISSQRIRVSRRPSVPRRDVVREQLALRGDLGAGVARADDDERAPGGALGGVALVVRQLELPDDVVAQVEGLGDPAEAVRVLGDARDRQQLVHAAGGEHQPVVGQRAVVAVRAPVRDGAAADVDAVRAAQHDPDAGQRLGERDRHPPRVEDAPGHLGQQRQVEEVVGRVEDRDVEGAAGPAC